MNHEKSEAAAAVTQPLFEESPAEETGLNASHVLPAAIPPPQYSSSTNPFRQSSQSSAQATSSTNPFHQPPHGSPQLTSTTTTGKANPTTTTAREFPLRHSPHNSISHSPRSSIDHNRRTSGDHRREAFSTYGTDTRPRRRSSLRERYPGDPSVRPLDQLAHEKHIADKSRHTTRKHSIPVDTIDALDSTGIGSYHHGGPYDATLAARNNSYTSSPVAAVASSNAEALEATPKDKITDSLERHRPLDGVAAYPPGTTDRDGNLYQYEEGENMHFHQAGGGAYKRYEGVYQYDDQDFKGKGEPSFSIEQALKKSGAEGKYDRHHLDEGGIEMNEMENRGNVRDGVANGRASVDNGRRGSGHGTGYGMDDSMPQRKGSLRDGLRMRVGSIKKKLMHDD